MRNTFTAVLLAVLAMTIFLALGDGDRGPEAMASTGTAAADAGSALPCAVPLAWRMDHVDPAFGITVDQAHDAVHAAVALWEDAAGSRLFEHDPRGGFPVRFIYDGRQTASEDRRRAESDLRRTDDRLSARRTELEELSRAHRRDADAFHDRARVLEAQLAEHNRTVEGWNDRGGAPSETVRALRSTAAALDAESAVLDRWRQELESTGRRIQEAQDQLNRDIDAHNRRVADLRAAFPPATVQSAVYREEARVVAGRAISARREIDVFQFDDADELIRIIAHELGHALGLGHISEPGALMSEAFGRTPHAAATLGAPDLALFRSVCPGLLGEGGR